MAMSTAWRDRDASVELVCGNGESITVPVAVASVSKHLRDMMFMLPPTGDGEIMQLPVQTVDSPAMVKVVSFMHLLSDSHRLPRGLDDSIDEFLDQNLPSLFPLMLAGLHLKIERLQDACRDMICTLVRGFTAEQIRDNFNLVPSAEDSSTSMSESVVESGMTFVFVNEQEVRPPRRRTRQRHVAADNSARQCSRCDVEFSTTVRRHHCRNCRDAFCHKCAGEYKVLAPAQRDLAEQLIGVDFLTKFRNTVTNALTGKPLDAVRICYDCNLQLSEENRNKSTVQVFRLCGFDIPELMTLSQVSPNWRHAALLCLHDVCALQHSLPTHEFSEGERRQLWANRAHFAGHSRWLVQLLKAVDWSSDLSSQAALEVLRRPRTISCADLQCEGRCCEALQPEDGLELLSGYAPATDPDVRRYAVRALRGASLERLRCFLPVLVHALRDERHAATSPLLALLLEKATQDGDLCSELYWELEVNSCDGPRRAMYKRLRDRLLIHVSEQCGAAVAEGLTREHEFLGLITEAAGPDLGADAIGSSIRSRIANSLVFEEGPVPLLLNHGLAVVDVEERGIRVMDSKVRPVVVPCVCAQAGPGSAGPSPPRPTPAGTGPATASEAAASSEKTVRLLFKGEDLRKDSIVIRIVDLMNTHLAESGVELGIPDSFSLLTYRVRPTSASAGVMEWVEQSASLLGIEQSTHKTIQNYLQNHNMRKGADFFPVQREFMMSLAGYTVVTFLLGVGDRHKENMMLTQSGRFFHIDYGFILGEDPKPLLKTNLALRPQMLQAMGGKENDLHEEFKALTSAIYKCLRRHAPEYISLLLLLVNAQPTVELAQTRESLEREFIQRFMLGKTDDEAARIMMTWLEGGEDWKDYFHDIIHEYPKVQRGAVETVGLRTQQVWQTVARKSYDGTSRILGGLRTMMNTLAAAPGPGGSGAGADEAGTEEEFEDFEAF